MLAYSRVWASMGQKLQLMGCGSKITRKIVHCFILNALLVCGTLFLGNTKNKYHGRKMAYCRGSHLARKSL